MKWIKIVIDTVSEAVEVIYSQLSELGIESIEIIDPKELLAQQGKSQGDWDYIDENIFSGDIGKVKIICYLCEEGQPEKQIQQIKDELHRIQKFLPIGTGELLIEEVDDQDWENNWKEYYKPIAIGKSLLILPSWEPLPLEYSDRKVIQLDPGMAFGTGDHETTSMCLEALENYLSQGDLIYDVGCGSGILSIAAAKLGAKKVMGIDIDEKAVKVAKENVELNLVSDRVTIACGDLLDLVQEKADIIVANIIADVIIHLTEEIRRYIQKKGTFIASGIIIQCVEDVKKAYTENGFELLDEIQNGSWAALIFTLKE